MTEKNKAFLLLAMGMPLLDLSHLTGNDVVEAATVFVGATLTSTALVLAVK